MLKWNKKRSLVKFGLTDYWYILSTSGSFENLLLIVVKVTQWKKKLYGDELQSFSFVWIKEKMKLML